MNLQARTQDDQTRNVDPNNDANPEARSELACRNNKASRLTSHWRRANGGLLMNWCLVDAEARAPSSSAGAPSSQREEPLPNDGGAHPPPQFQTRTRSVIEWIAIAVILGGTGFVTALCFFGEHNNLVL
jgi:hypothetical protein